MERMDARPPLAYCGYAFARMLEARRRPGDRARAGALVDEALARARELEMPALAARSARLHSDLFIR